MKQLTLFSILLFLMMPSCTHQESSNDVFKDVPIIIDIESVRSDSLKLGHIQYIPLETSEECLIGNIKKMLIKNNKIYVADFKNAMVLFVFDMNGKFLFKISKRGQGPGEYISFFDFDIQSNGDIYIFDQHGKKILIYNSIGKFLREINMDYFFHKFGLVNNKIYCSKISEEGKELANLAVYDMRDKKTDFILQDNKFSHDFDIMNNTNYDFYYTPDRITYYSPKFSPIIYSIGKEGVRPAIGIKNLKIPSENIIDGWLRVKNVFERANLVIKSNYFIQNVYIYETDKHISIGCVRGFLGGIVLYEKKSKSAFEITSHELFSKLGIAIAQGSTGKEFFAVVSFDVENNFHKEILESREELKNWKEDDNPVIVLFNPDM